MLSFSVRSLAQNAIAVDGEMAPDDPAWMDFDARPVGPLIVQGRLSAAGAGRFYFSGKLRGALTAECRRCLAPVNVGVEEEFTTIFAEPDVEGSEDPDVFAVDTATMQVDLREAVREQWLLSAPRFALCRDDCRGLCPNCGANLNEGECSCSPVTDSRWDALKSVRFE